MLAITHFVSWNQGGAIGRFVLAACLLLAVAIATPLVVAAIAPMVAGCCTAVCANAGAWAMVPVVFGGMWAVKP